MRAEIHYLNWDRHEGERDEEFWEMQDIRDGEEEPGSLFHYRQVGTMYANTKSEVFDACQRGRRPVADCVAESDERSMCPGDLIRMEETWFLVNPVGFTALEDFPGHPKTPIEQDRELGVVPE